MIFYGMIIGFALAFVMDFLFTMFIEVSLSTVLIGIVVKIGQKIWDLIYPIIRLDITIWLFKNGHNPWHITVSEMLHTSDEEFNQWLKFLTKSQRAQWEKMREPRKKMK